MSDRDVKGKILGSVVLGFGERKKPIIEELHPRRGEVVVSFCTKCGKQMGIDLEYANFYAEEAGLPQQTKESLAGKYLQVDACMRCDSCSGDEDNKIKILDIPEHERHIPNIKDLCPRKDGCVAVCFCINCGSYNEVTWEYVDCYVVPEIEFAAGIRSKESLAGKYIENSSCKYCTGFEFHTGREVRVLDIPKQ